MQCQLYYNYEYVFLIYGLTWCDKRLLPRDKKVKTNIFLTFMNRKWLNVWGALVRINSNGALALRNWVCFKVSRQVSHPSSEEEQTNKQTTNIVILIYEQKWLNVWCSSVYVNSNSALALRSWVLLHGQQTSFWPIFWGGVQNHQLNPWNKQKTNNKHL